MITKKLENFVGFTTGKKTEKKQLTEKVIRYLTVSKATKLFRHEQNLAVIKTYQHS